MRKLAFLGFAIFVAAAVVVGSYFWYSKLKVDITVKPDKQLLGLKDNITVNVKPSFVPPRSFLEITLNQNNKTLIIFKGPLKEFSRTFVLEPKKEGFKEGKAELIATLKTPFYKKNLYIKSFQLDLTPPSAEIIYEPPRLKVAHLGIVAVKPSEKLTSASVKFGNAEFPLLKYGNNGTLLTFITPPLFALKKPSTFELVLTDLAGNKSVIPLSIKVIPIKLQTRKIFFRDETLKKLLLKYFHKISDPVSQFKTINEVFRKEDEKKFISICRNSTANLSINGTFLQLPGSAVKARFGEHRLYYFKDKFLGESIHKGLDLAKYKHAPVPAANNGRVIFVGKTKVYGNVVLIDHGYGLVSLYAHLNDFTVKPGQKVKKGEIIGHTDTTGFALGDHLHFGVLVWGYATNPYFYLIKWNMNHYIYRHLKNIH